ncbi:helix-turn-helix domain-containing protein, partial [Klebsiella pneumoniae]|uniref:helix-turn-helix domain-containing protein n=1 Tax=Klebsiella pneumoniae TaxID=573 RepID=UPI001D0E625D
RKRAYCLKIQPATGSFARNLIYSTKPLSRRQRQKQGIERAHTLGKYQGKQADRERHQKVLYYRQVKKLSIRETADATGYSASQVCRIQALYKNNEFS